ncbi:MAG: hypothetical protein M0Z96_09485 [Actinomycetota bacterium]|nr:hypothetical protein [Actinomycetota bacterium]
MQHDNYDDNTQDDTESGGREEQTTATEIHDSDIGSDSITYQEPDGAETGASEETSQRRAGLVFALKAVAIGVVVGLLIGGFGFIRNRSSQSELADKLIKADTCLGATTSPNGFCFNSPVKVSLVPSNPVSELFGSQDVAVISAARSRIGGFANTTLKLRLAGFTGAGPGSSAPLAKTKVRQVNGTMSLAYSDLTHTLQSGSNNGASIFYVGNNEIGTSNQITYQGKQIPLVVISKIQLKNGQLFLTPETVNALGRTAPASSVFSSVAPVPVTIPTLPKGMAYESLTTTKQYLIFKLAGTSMTLNSLFNAK